MRLLLIFNAVLLAVGICGGPLIMRLYFNHKGKRVWLSSWLETGGWPINFIPLIISYLHRRSRQGPRAKVFFMEPPVFLASVVIGVLTGVDNYFYAYGMRRLPVSTSSLIIASQLGLTAVFAYFLVNQKFTECSINAVVLLTIGPAILALHTSSDWPEGESKRAYVLGFVMTIVSAVLYGLILPMVEKIYKKAKQEITYTLVIEFQLVMCFVATVMCTIGMYIDHDFKAIPKEAKEFTGGETTYYIVLVWSAIIWQCCFLGAIGVIFSASSLLAAIIMAVLLPITEILAVDFFGEKFQAEKGISLAISLWGFASYIYGEIKQSKKIKKRNAIIQMPQINGAPWP